MKEPEDFLTPANQPLSVPAETLQKLREIGTCTLCHGLVDLGIKNTYLRGVKPMALPEGETSFVGRARTLRFVPLREDLCEIQYANNTRSPHRVAIESIEMGEVLVIDTGGNIESGVIGDIFTLRVKQRGGCAIVIDGVLRDLQGIRRMGLPVYAAGIHGAGIPRAQISVGVNEPVRCGGVAVFPEDILIGDEDGVVVIPPHLAQRLADEYFGKIDYERWVRERLRAGADLHVYYQFPPLPEVYAEYQRSKLSETVVSKEVLATA